jgi:plastocyanin
MRRLLPLLMFVALLSDAAIAQPSPSAAPSPAPSPALVVHIANYVYTPDPVNVHPGDTVLFVNDDAVPHTVTATDRSFDSGDLQHGASWSHTFANAGTFTYRCAYHAFMHGRIIVSAP